MKTINAINAIIKIYERRLEQLDESKDSTQIKYIQSELQELEYLKAQELSRITAIQESQRLTQRLREQFMADILEEDWEM